VVDDEEDIKYLNYCLSKNGVKLLCQINNIPTTALNNLCSQLNTSNRVNEQELSLLHDRIEDNISMLHSKMKSINKPIINGEALINYLEKDTNHKPKKSGHALPKEIIKSISSANYENYCALLSQAQVKYKSKFRFISNQSPLHYNEENNGIEEIQYFLKDKLEEALKIKNYFTDYKEQLERQNYDSKHTECSELKNHMSSIFEMYKKSNDDYTETEIIKIQFYVAKVTDCLLAHRINSQEFNRENVNDSIDHLKVVVDSFVLEYNEQLSEFNKQSLEAHTVYDSHNLQSNIRRIVEELRTLQKQLNNVDLFKKTFGKRATSFAFNLEILNELIEEIEYALFFIEENNEYFKWRDYYTRINESEKQIIDSFLPVKSSWTQVLEENFIESQLNNARLNSESFSQNVLALEEQVEQYVKAYPQVLVDKFIKVKSTNESREIPLVILTKDFFEDHQTISTHDYFYLNFIPEELSKSVNRKFFCYDDIVQFSAIKKLNHVNDLEIIDFKGIEYNLETSIEKLNSNELNLASLFLGSQLHQLTSTYTIFQFRSVSIVSFASKNKNFLLQELLYDEGIKQILTDGPSNLIPGLIADRSRRVVVITEDGLFNRSDKQSYINQILLKRKLTDAGIKVLDIDNFKLMNQDDNINSIANKIRLANKVEGILS